jgi:predicted RNA-binding protein associated with RNAse of E/G family
VAQVTIHLQRLGKPARSYVEELVSDDGVRVETFTRLPAAVSASLSAQFCQQGKIPPGSIIHSAAKTLFYHESYSIVVFRDAAGELLGCYCDIVTPLQKVGDDYVLTDLILDLWIAPDGVVQVLDEAEFQVAIQSGLIPPDLAVLAQTTLKSLTQGWKILHICSTIANMQDSRP